MKKPTYMPHKNFITGLGTLLNLRGNYYKSKKVLQKTNKQALAGDWAAVGKDFENVLG